MDNKMADLLKADLAVSDGQDHTVTMATDLATALELGDVDSGGHSVRLCFGLRSQPVTVVVDPGLPPGALRLTGRTARVLLLPGRGRLGIYWSEPGHLRLGPLVGVLISTTSLASLRKRRNRVYEAFTRYAAEVGAVIVFFTINGYKGSKTVRRRTRDGRRPRRPGQDYLAAFRLQRGRPVRVRTPLPRVIYDRCFGPGSRLQAIKLRHLIRSMGVTVINQPVKITKLATYQALRENRRLRAVVPFSAPLSLKALQGAGQRYPVLYLKPDNLSRGWGVYRVKRRGTSWLLERQAKGRGGRTRIFPGAGELLRWLPKQSPYLLQEAVDLATFMGNRFDFRALMQKDGAGRWELTGLVARIAPERGVVTSPRSGGMVSPPLRVLQAAFGPEGGLAALETLRETCLQIARQMEKAFGLCVELGIDIGITRDGEPKLIEVNGRPLKVSLDRLNDPATNQRIHRYPIYFAAHLDMGREEAGGPPQAAASTVAAQG